MTRILMGIALIWMIGVNAGANILPINGLTTGEISDAYPNLFAPAGITFSIWGLIYLLIAVFVFQSIFMRRQETTAVKYLIEEIAPFFIINAILNGLWILAWHHLKIGISVGIMVGLLATLIYIERMIRVRSQVPWTIQAPFSIYFGWITVATVANVTVWLVSLGWGRFGLSEVFWTVLIVLIGAVIGFATMMRFRDRLYGGVILWAYAGILWKHLSSSGFGGRYPYVIGAVIVSLILILVGEVMAKRTQGWV
ncbi:MAG: hypothetical protein PWQ12_2023 [Clostridiales bacterium]|jgi:hypothetical protein|nr:hypothetical protein [Clostridiales bacterium]